MVASKSSIIVAAVALGAASTVYAAPTTTQRSGFAAAKQQSPYADDLPAATAYRTVIPSQQLQPRYFDDSELYAREYYDELDARDYEDVSELEARYFDDDENELYARDFDEYYGLEARDFDDDDELFAREYQSMPGSASQFNAAPQFNGAGTHDDDDGSASGTSLTGGNTMGDTGRHPHPHQHQHQHQHEHEHQHQHAPGGVKTHHHHHHTGGGGGAGTQFGGQGEEHESPGALDSSSNSGGDAMTAGGLRRRSPIFKNVRHGLGKMLMGNSASSGIGSGSGSGSGTMSDDSAGQDSGNSYRKRGFAGNLGLEEEFFRRSYDDYEY